MSHYRMPGAGGAGIFVTAPAAALLAALVAFLPHSEPLRASVDLLERNHVHDPHTGRCVLVQWVAWEYHAEDGRHHVVAWWLDRLPCALVRTPRGYRLVWTTREDLHQVDAAGYVETWTTFDPELADREVWPVEWRRGLGKRPWPGSSR